MSIFALMLNFVRSTFIFLQLFDYILYVVDLDNVMIAPKDSSTHRKQLDITRKIVSFN